MDNLKINLGLSSLAGCQLDKEILQLTVKDNYQQKVTSVLLDTQEATQLRDWLNEALEGMG